MRHSGTSTGTWHAQIPSRPKSLAGGISIMLALASCAAFVIALDNRFVNWDDHENFVNNGNYRGLGLSQFAWAWRTYHLGVYQPLSWILLEAEHAIWGLSAWGYHLSSLVLHAVNAVVLYLLTIAVLRRCRLGSDADTLRSIEIGAGLAVALFMVHPLRVEAVAWASCQPYLPCALCSMLSVAAYLRAHDDDRESGRLASRGWLLTSFLLFAAALLFKAVAVSIPMVFLILDVYPLRRFRGGPGCWFGKEARQAWWEKIPFLVLSVAFMVVAVRAKAESVIPMAHAGLGSRVSQACYGVWFYLIKTVVPVGIIAFYPLPRSLALTRPLFAAAAVGVVAVTSWLLVIRRRWPGALAAWTSYLVMLAPNAGLARIGTQIAADRYSYVAMMALVMLGAAVLARLLRSGLRMRARLVTTACLGAILGLILLSWDLCRAWHDSETLWAYALTHGPKESPIVHRYMGLTLVEDGTRFDEAETHIREGLRTLTNDADTRCDLGYVLLMKGKFDEAQAEFAESLRLDPRSANTRFYLAYLLHKRGELDAARAEFDRAVRLRPDHANTHLYLAFLLLDQGKRKEASAEFAQVLQLDPGNTTARFGLARVSQPPKQSTSAP